MNEATYRRENPYRVAVKQLNYHGRGRHRNVIIRFKDKRDANRYLHKMKNIETHHLGIHHGNKKQKRRTHTDGLFGDLYGRTTKKSHGGFW